jgi:bla regulator protein BlaR1
MTEIVKIIFEDSLLNALGWTFVHSLWQFLIIAAVFGFVLKLISSKKAGLKYWISVLAMLLSFIVALVTFQYYYSQSNSSANIENEILSQITLNEGFLEASNESESTLFLSGVLSSIKNKFPLIIFFWFAGIIILSIRMLTGFLWVKKIKNQSYLLEDKGLLQKLRSLVNTVGINRRVTFKLTEKISGPIVTGFFKPVVFLPASVFMQMPYEQLESIVLHELAHIKRLDYLLNIIQIIIESLFFYHPGIWYLSGVVRNERENRCDDYALEFTGDPLIYVKALTKLKEIETENKLLSMAFAGNKNQLLNRIKRLVMKPVKSKFYFEKLTAILLFVTILLFALIKPEKTSYADTDPGFNEAVLFSHGLAGDNPVSPLPPDSIPKKDTLKCKKVIHRKIEIKNGEIQTNFVDKKDKKTKKIKLKVADGEVEEVFVDGKKLTPEETKEYQPVVDKTINEVKELEIDLEASVKEIKKLDKEMLIMDIRMAQKDLEMEEFDKERLKEELERAKLEVERINFDSLNAELKEVQYDLQVTLKELDNAKKDIMIIRMENDEMKELSPKQRKKIKKSMKKVTKEMEDIDLNTLILNIPSSNEIIDSAFVKNIKISIDQSLENLDRMEFNINIEDLDKSIKAIENIDTSKIIIKIDSKLKEIKELELK